MTEMKKLNILCALLTCIMVTGCTTEEVIFDIDLQFAADLQLVDDFLETNQIAAIRDPSGVSYVVLDEGMGASSRSLCSIGLKMTVYGLDSAYFFSNYEEVEEQNGFLFPFRESFYINKCNGLNELEGLHVLDALVGIGGKVQFFVPSRLGWGSAGYGDGNFSRNRRRFFTVPANTNLLITAELTDLQ